MGEFRPVLGAKSLQSCLTLCDPMDRVCQAPLVHGILQAIILEWVAISMMRLLLRTHKGGKQIEFLSILPHF